MTLTIAVDVGGSQLRACLIDPLEQTNSLRVPRLTSLIGERWDLTNLRFDSDVVNKIVSFCEKAAGSRKSEVGAVGVAFTGAIDIAGKVHPTHVQDGREQDVLFPLVTKLQQRFHSDLEVVVENRSFMGAWGEFQFGWGRLERGLDDLVYLSWTSGLGAGIVIHQQPYAGARGFAGQIGHILVGPGSGHRCPVCLQSGCLSSTVGGSALLREVVARKADPAIASLLGRLAKVETPATEDAGHVLTVGSSTIDARAVVKAALDGDRGAWEVVLTVAKPLARAVAQIASLLDPAIIVLGGIGYDVEFLELAASQEAAQYLPPFRKGKNRLERSQLHDLAPLYGAAAWVWNKPH